VVLFNPTVFSDIIPKYEYVPAPKDDGTLIKVRTDPVYTYVRGSDGKILKLHAKPENFGYPDVSKLFPPPPNWTPIYGYYPAPRDDGAFIKVLLNDYPLHPSSSKIRPNM